MLKKMMIAAAFLLSACGTAFAEDDRPPREMNIETLGNRVGINLLCMYGFVHAMNGGTPFMITQSISIDGLGGDKARVMGWDKARINLPIPCNGEKLSLK